MSQLDMIVCDTTVIYNKTPCATRAPSRTLVLVLLVLVLLVRTIVLFAVATRYDHVQHDTAVDIKA
jgi:hypothetical protein